MSKKFAGLAVASSEIDVVILTRKDGYFELVSQSVIKKHTGGNPQAYNVVYQQLKGLLVDTGVEQVFVKASAVSMGGTSLAHLEACELRGVALAAAASVCTTECVTKANISRNFGERKADEYLKDNSFWESQGLGALKKGAREAALIAVSQVS